METTYRKPKTTYRYHDADRTEQLRFNLSNKPMCVENLKIGNSVTYSEHYTCGIYGGETNIYEGRIDEKNIVMYHRIERIFPGILKIESEKRI